MLQGGFGDFIYDNYDVACRFDESAQQYPVVEEAEENEVCSLLAHDSRLPAIFAIGKVEVLYLRFCVPCKILRKVEVLYLQLFHSSNN
eukprot:scaffold3357_cov127-Skeletonema_marinoi.AAC.4